jgi:hypothetical protein
MIKNPLTLFRNKNSTDQDMRENLDNLLMSNTVSVVIKDGHGNRYVAEVENRKKHLLTRFLTSERDKLVNKTESGI